MATSPADAERFDDATEAALAGAAEAAAAPSLPICGREVESSKRLSRPEYPETVEATSTEA